MTNPEDREDEAVARLVSGYLDQVAKRTDATGLQSRICEGLRSSPRLEASSIRPSPASPRFFRCWPGSLGWTVAAATVAIAAFLGGWHFQPASANAAILLRQAQVVHAQGVDRCYRVHYAPDPRYWDGKNSLEGPSESVLWTRGDRFWSDCSIGPLRLAIGRAEDGTLWVRSSPKKGIRFEGEPSRLPRDVAVLCDLNSLTLPVLIDDVLGDFDLEAQRASGPARGTIPSLVWARLKPGRSHPLISTALMEIDAQSNAILRLVLWLVREGRPNGTVTYTLIESARREDQSYRLDFHLDPDAVIEIQSIGSDEAENRPDAP